MKNILKCILIFSSVFLSPIVAGAADLTSTASVNVTSDTASNAKIMAFNEARRQITTDVLSNYTDKEKFNELIKNTDDSKLTNLISSTNIDGERLSSTTYSANIKMTLDTVEAKKWLSENNIPNWLGNNEALVVDRATVVIDIPDGLRDWIDLNHAIQTEKLDIEIKRIFGDQVTVTVLMTDRSKIIAVVRILGWKYSENNGFLRIWK
ncbi:MAG: hypothetical protein JW974_00275 [Alphaproteobacteria bacterium]|nr:hypothetical protein [Alphaproteobacteria bacterium]MBN2675049.1 hypothetical protein [Alphaproteobacteria bacterium]